MLLTQGFTGFKWRLFSNSFQIIEQSSGFGKGFHNNVNQESRQSAGLQIVAFGEPAESLSLVGTGLIMSGTISLTLSKMYGITCGILF